MISRIPQEDTGEDDLIDVYDRIGRMAKNSGRLCILVHAHCLAWKADSLLLWVALMIVSYRLDSWVTIIVVSMFIVRTFGVPWLMDTLTEGIDAESDT